MKDAQLWDRLARTNKNRSHIDPVFGRYKSEQFCAFATRGHQFRRGEKVLKTDLREEAYGADEVLFSLPDPGLSIFGMDISAEVAGAASAESLKRGSTHHYVTADVRRIPFADHSLDVVLSNSTLDHFSSYEDLLAALAEIRRVLKPTGKLIMTLNNKHNLNFWFMVTMEKALGISRYPVVFFSRAEIRRACEKAGLRVLGFESIIHIVSPLNTCALLARRFVPQPQADRMARAVLKLAAFFERCGTTKWLTGWFIGAVCVPGPESVAGE